MSTVATMLIILLVVSIALCLPHTYDPAFGEPPCATRRVATAQGLLCGLRKDLVVKQLGGPTYQFLKPVEQYLGVPYALPPVGDLRFMPPTSAPTWSGTRMATRFGPVCPQMFPSTQGVRPERRQYLEQLMGYLRTQAEDCLYLNVYAPEQG